MTHADEVINAAVERLATRLEAEVIAPLRADLKVAQSRVFAYQYTCDVQGRKLAEIAVLLSKTSLTDPTLKSIQSILNRKDNQ